jgi:osmotically-inducible protein OsmY
MVMLTTACTKQEERSAEGQLSTKNCKKVVKTRLQSDAGVGRLNLEVNADAEHRAVELQGLAYTQRQRTRAVELARAAGLTSWCRTRLK